MTNNNQEVLERIKQTFESEVGEKRNLQVSGNIDFIIDGNDVVMNVPAKAVCTNMQGDKASFEGWALVLKRWGKFTNIILHWDRSDVNTGTPEGGHYQRFLFRVDCFKNHFNAWFKVDDNCNYFLKYLEINDHGPYYLNKPSKNRDNREPQLQEGILEKRFVKGDLKEPLAKLTNAIYIDRQLPVGVFKNSVSKETGIFSRGKSAIDIWGFDNENNLVIYELKAEKNDKVGIMSEIYLYSNILRMVQNGKFGYEDPIEERLKKIVQTKRVKAYMLSPFLHPLIDKKLVDEINKCTNPEIDMHFIRFDESNPWNIKLEF